MENKNRDLIRSKLGLPDNPFCQEKTKKPALIEATINTKRNTIHVQGDTITLRNHGILLFISAINCKENVVELKIDIDSNETITGRTYKKDKDAG